MPLYEYLCDACQHRFELIRKFSDPPLEACPRCGGTVQKLVSSPAFQFKGSGWYATDYAKKAESGKASGGAEKSDKSDTSEKSEKKDSSSSESKDKAASDSSSKSSSSSESTSKDSSAAPATKTS
jgi:putative FmdB family regulatory protein